jgi:hypothetical protein
MSVSGRLTTSDTVSTSRPTTREPTFITTMTLNLPYSAEGMPNISRSPITGTTVPRRFITPLIDGGELGRRVIAV